MKELYVLMDLSSSSYKGHENNLDYLKKELGEVIIVDVSKLLKTQTSVDYKIFENFKIKIIKNFYELREFLGNKDIIIMYTLNDKFKYFFINHYLSKYNTKKFIISNLGYNPENFNYYKKNIIEKINIFFKLRFNYYINRILVLLRILPKIEYFFESSGFIINSINNGKSNKLKSIFPWINFSYYLNVIRINSRHYDNLFYSKYPISENYIVFVDGAVFDHKDRIMREGKPNPIKRKKYYENLYKILKKLEVYYSKKIVVCLHPKNNTYKLNNDFKDLFCIKYQTEKYISEANIVVFHEGSSIIQAIVQKKKIINLNGSILGDYLQKRSDLYTKELELHQIDIDNSIVESKDNLDVYMGNSIKNYEQYIKNNIINDPAKSGISQIIEYLYLK